MLLYYLKPRKNKESKNPKVTKTKNFVCFVLIVLNMMIQGIKWMK